MQDSFVLPIGFMLNGTPVKTLGIANISGEAETVLTRKPKKGKLYTWMGQVASAAVDSIGGEAISAPFISRLHKNPDEVPELVQRIPLIDIGSLLIQIQRECWEDEIENQRVRCIHCGSTMQKVTLELNKIELPEGDPVPVESFLIDLKQDIGISAGESTIMQQYDGLKYNHIRVRVPTLKDAITAQFNVRTAGDEKQEIDFWRDVLFNCITEFIYKDPSGAGEIALPDGYLAKRGKLLFTKDWNTKVNKHVRKMLQTTLPSANFFYLDECTSCHEETPFYANSGSFFAS